MGAAMMRGVVGGLACVGLLLVGCSGEPPTESPATGAAAPRVTDGAAARIPSDQPSAPEESVPTVDRAQPTPRTRIGAPTSSVPLAPQPGGLAKPPSWPAYTFSGPKEADVCRSAQFPLDQLLRTGDGQSAGDDAQSVVIRSAQAGLRSLNYGQPDPVDPTGYFGAVTVRAVRSFQQRKELTVDGTLGPETWAALHYWVNAYRGNCP